MALYIRMALYALSMLFAGQGLAIYDAQAGTLTFHVDDLAVALSGAGVFVGTFVASRFATVR
jgi:hypothetical protein